MRLRNAILTGAAFAFQQARRGHWPEAKRAWKDYRKCHSAGEIFCDAPSHYWKSLWARLRGEEAAA